MSKDMAVIGFIGVVSAATTVILMKWYRTRQWILADTDIWGAPVVVTPPVEDPGNGEEPVAVVMG